MAAYDRPPDPMQATRKNAPRTGPPVPNQGGIAAKPVAPQRLNIPNAPSPGATPGPAAPAGSVLAPAFASALAKPAPIYPNRDEGVIPVPPRTLPNRDEQPALYLPGNGGTGGGFQTGGGLVAPRPLATGGGFVAPPPPPNDLRTMAPPALPPPPGQGAQQPAVDQGILPPPPPPSPLPERDEHPPRLPPQTVLPNRGEEPPRLPPEDPGATLWPDAQRPDATLWPDGARGEGRDGAVLWPDAQGQGGGEGTDGTDRTQAQQPQQPYRVTRTLSYTPRREEIADLQPGEGVTTELGDVYRDAQTGRTRLKLNDLGKQAWVQRRAVMRSAWRERMPDFIRSNPSIPAPDWNPGEPMFDPFSGKWL